MQKAFGRIEVDVFTPEPLSDDGREAIRARIQDALRQEPVLYTYTDPSMIGGIKLRIGDQLIDASVATRVRRMRERILGAGPVMLAERFDRLVENGDAVS